VLRGRNICFLWASVMGAVSYSCSFGVGEMYTVLTKEAVVRLFNVSVCTPQQMNNEQYLDAAELEVCRLGKNVIFK